MPIHTADTDNLTRQDIFVLSVSAVWSRHSDLGSKIPDE